MTSPRSTKAVIFVQATTDFEAASRCLQHCQVRRYEVVGIVSGDWQAAARVLRDGLAGVLVVDNRADIPPDAEPRLEIVAEEPTPAVEHRRTRPVRRGNKKISRRDAAT